MLEVVVGCMFSGKSEELTRRLRREEIAGKKVFAFKPAIDNRYHPDDIASHSSVKFKAKTFKNAADLVDKIEKIIEKESDNCVIGIDEVQFLDKGFASTIDGFANNGLKIIVAGLDMDYTGNPFGPMPELMAIGDKVIKLNAICVAKDENGTICGEPATRSYRIFEKNTQDIIQVGALDSYEARCRECWKRGPK